MKIIVTATMTSLGLASLGGARGIVSICYYFPKQAKARNSVVTVWWYFHKTFWQFYVTTKIVFDENPCYSNNTIACLDFLELWENKYDYVHLLLCHPKKLKYILLLFLLPAFSQEIFAIVCLYSKRFLMKLHVTLTMVSLTLSTLEWCNW